jgi:hypothetical protein
MSIVAMPTPSQRVGLGKGKEGERMFLFLFLGDDGLFSGWMDGQVLLL